MQNIAGFMIGRSYEEKGIAKDGAKLVNAVSTVTVPKLTLIIGGSFGAGNYAMCGRAYSPRFLFSWPNSKISVMGGEIAANVLSYLKEAQYEKLGKKWKAEKRLNFQKEIISLLKDEKLVGMDVGSKGGFNSDGYFATNHHVIEGCRATQVKVNNELVNSKIISFNNG